MGRPIPRGQARIGVCNTRLAQLTRSPESLGRSDSYLKGDYDV